MPLIDQITSLFALLDDGLQSSVLVISQEKGQLSREEKLAIDTVNFGALMLGLTSEALKFAEMASNITMGLSIAQTILGVAAQTAATLLNTRNTSGLRKQKPLTPQDVFQKRQKNMPLSMEAFSDPAFEGLDKLAPLILGDELKATTIPKIMLSGPMGLKHIGQNLAGLNSQHRRVLVNAFTKACQTYVGSSWNPSDPSGDLVALLLPNAKRGERQTLLAHQDFPDNIPEDVFLEWLKPQSKKEMLETFTGNAVNPLGIIDALKLKAEVKRLGETLGHTKKDKTGLDNVLSMIVKTPELRKKVISEEAMQVHQGLTAKSSDENKLQGIIDYLSTVQFNRNFMGKLDSRLAVCIEEELIKNQETGSTAFKEDLFECYSQSYGAIHDRYLIKEDGASYTRGEALAFVRTHLLNFTKIKQAMAKIPEDIEDFHINKKTLPSMGKIAALLGLLDPTTHKEEIKACKKYLSMCQTLIRMKVLEEKPESEPMVTAAIHELLQNITEVSMSNRYVRLDEKDKVVQQTNQVIKGTTKILSGASAASMAFFPPAAPAFGAAGAITGVIGTGIGWIKFGATEEEFTRSISIPKPVSLKDTKKTLHDLSATLRECGKKTSALIKLQNQLEKNELRNADTDLARSLNTMITNIDQYRKFIIDSAKKVQALQYSFNSIEAEFHEDHIHNDWEELYDISQTLDELKTQFQSKSMAILANYESIKDTAQNLLDNPENETKALFK